MATLLDPFEELIKKNNSTIPFVQFFISGMICKMFTHIDDIERLKEKNPLYASYIDRWITYAIKTDLISVQQSGELDLEKIFFKNVDGRYDGPIDTKEINKITGIVDTITSLAAHQFTEKTQEFYSINYFFLQKENRDEAIQIFNEFYFAMKKLSRSTDLPVESKEMIAIGVSTAGIDHDTFSNI